MKNKLTTEEQMLKEKLNEASFSYDQTNWNEMQSMLENKGFFSKYKPFIKAVAAFVILSSSVFLINELQSDDSIPTENQSVVKDKVTTNTTPETIASEEPNNEEISISSDQGNNKNTSRPHISGPSTNSEIEHREVKDILSEKELNAFSEPNTTERNVIVEKTVNADNSKQVTPQKPDYKVHLTSIQLHTPACPNSPIAASVNVEGTVPASSRFKWFVNGAEMDELSRLIRFEPDHSGSNQLAVQLVMDNKILSEISSEILVEETVELNFIDRDVTDLFYDMDVNLIALTENDQNLIWYVNPNGRTQSGKETTWTFEKEGIHEITLEHTSENGCIYRLSKAVQVKRDFISAFPRYFTPDNDGKNDEFILEVFSSRKDRFLLQIFDQSNKLVFETNSPNEGWNGRMNNKGVLLPFGTYAWQVTIENKQGVKKNYMDKVKMRDF